MVITEMVLYFGGLSASVVAPRAWQARDAMRRVRGATWGRVRGARSRGARERRVGARERCTVRGGRVHNADDY